MIKTFSTKKMYVFYGIIIVFCLMIGLTVILQPGEIIAEPTGQAFPLILLKALIGQIFPMFIIIIAVDMITNEYRNGTFKLPLLHPVSRRKYILSKIFSIVVLIITLLGFTLISSYIIGTIFFGWGDGVMIDGNLYQSIEGIFKMLTYYGISIAPLTAFSMLAVVLALTFSNTGIAVGLSIGLLLALDVAKQLFPEMGFYIINSTFYIFESLFNSSLYNVAISQVLITLIYGFISLIISDIIIKKKEILY
jgi:ABC-2 type transport system permease protein